MVIIKYSELSGFVPAKLCYQCAYSPPKTYYSKKVKVEHGRYHGQDHGHDSYGDRHNNYGDRHNNYGDRHNDGYGRGGHKSRGYGGSYTKKTVHPFHYTVDGGWDKCMGPFDSYKAKEYGVDVWDCHSNCYTRKDKSGG